MLAGSIDATKLSSGAVDNTEFNYLDGVTGAIQTQLDGKQTKTLTDGKVWIGDGTNVAAAQTLTGDATIDNAGVLTIGSGAVTSAKIADGTIVAADMDLTGTYNYTGTLQVNGNNVLTSASSIAFSGLTGGTNTTATMLVGAGGSIAPSGGDVISNKFIGTGSTTNAVDLASAEVDGVLPDANVANNLTIDGGTIDNTAIGATTPYTGAFTSLSVGGLTTLNGQVTINNNVDVSQSTATDPSIAVANTGSAPAIAIDNGAGTGLALSISDGGGAVKLSSSFATVSSNALTIPDDVSVYHITSDNNGTGDTITMPAGVEGKILYVVFTTSSSDNAIFGVYTTTQSASITFVYVNSSWRVLSVYE
jgi:hypothetical protein